MPNQYVTRLGCMKGVKEDVVNLIYKAIQFEVVLRKF